MDSCVIPQGLVCCGGIVPNLSPVKEKATCTFVNLSASTSLSILFAQTSPPPSHNVSFLKMFHFEESPRCSSHKHVFLISFVSAQPHMGYIFVCMCLFMCIYISTYLTKCEKRWFSVSFGFKKYQCCPLNLNFDHSFKEVFN